MDHCGKSVGIKRVYQLETVADTGLYLGGNKKRLGPGIRPGDFQHVGIELNGGDRPATLGCLDGGISQTGGGIEQGTSDTPQGLYHS